MKSLGRAFLLLCLLGLSRAWGAEETGPYHSDALDVTFPAETAGMRIGWVTDYEKESGPGLGVGLSYRRPKEKADVYIYDNRLPAIPSDVDNAVVREHFAQVTSEIEEMERLGRYADVKVGPVETVTIDGRRWLHNVSEFSQENEARISHTYLTVMDNQFVKIRFTYFQSEAATGAKMAQEFAEGISEVLKGK